MTPEELKAQNDFLETVKTQVNGLISSKFGDTLPADVASLKADLAKTSSKDELAALKTQLEEIGLSVKGITEKEANPVQKDFVSAFKDAYTEKKSEIDTIISKGGKQSGPLIFNVKSAVTMGDFNTIEAVGSDSHYSLTSNTGIISVLRKRILSYLSAVSVGGISVDRPYAMWIEELDEQGAPIFIGEGDDKIQLSVRYEEREKKAKKIGVYGKVTTEMLRYLPQLISYIQNNLVKRMDIKTEDGLFFGDDNGDNLAGINEYATAFDGDALAGTIFEPNDYDVIRAVALQSQNAFGNPNAIFVHPTVIARMDLSKSLEGVYLMPPFKSADGSVIGGMRIIPTNAIGEDQFFGGDLSVVHVGFTDQSSIQVGLDGNDFTKNLKTILVEQELVQFVSANDTQVLIKGTFAAAKLILSIPS